MSCSRKIMSVLLVFSLLAVLCFPAFAAPKIRQNMMSNSTLKMINDLRKSEGIDALKIDDDLMKAAEIRALESAQKYSQEHVRPNGQKFFSVSTKVWAENTSYGHKSQQDVFNSLAKSKGHRANMLDKRMTIVGYACAEGDDGTLYWVQVFGTGASNYSWAMKDWGVKTFTLDPFNNPNTPRDKAAGDTASPVEENPFRLKTLQNATTAIQNAWSGREVYDNNLTSLNNQLTRLNRDIAAKKDIANEASVKKALQDADKVIGSIDLDHSRTKIYAKKDAPVKTTAEEKAATQRRLDNIKRNLDKAMKQYGLK